MLVFGVLHASALVGDSEDAKDAWASPSSALVKWEDWAARTIMIGLYRRRYWSRAPETPQQHAFTASHWVAAPVHGHPPISHTSPTRLPHQLCSRPRPRPRVPRHHHVCVGGAADAAYVPIRAVAAVLPVIATLSTVRHMRRSAHAGRSIVAHPRSHVHRRPHTDHVLGSGCVVTGAAACTREGAQVSICVRQ